MHIRRCAQLIRTSSIHSHDRNARPTAAVRRRARGRADKNARPLLRTFVHGSIKLVTQLESSKALHCSSTQQQQQAQPAEAVVGESYWAEEERAAMRALRRAGRDG